MQHYHSPLRDMRYVIEDWLQAPQAWRTMPAMETLDSGLAEQILEEAARFASDVLAPINANGDRQGCHYAHGQVRTPMVFPLPTRPLSRVVGRPWQPAPRMGVKGCRRYSM